jgi:hypothetical protein
MLRVARDYDCPKRCMLHLLDSNKNTELKPLQAENLFMGKYRNQFKEDHESIHDHETTSDLDYKTNE